MKTRLFVIIGIIFASFFGFAYASITVTPFELDIASDSFYESYPNKHPYLIMKPDDSHQITIQVTNTDETSNIVNLFMVEETPRPDRHFVFEPDQLHLESGETASSILTVGPNPDADTGTTILHTLIVQSTSFGTKSFAFYVKITDQIIPPSPDPIHRMGPDGMMFSPTAQFNLSEIEVFETISYDVLPPILSDEYSFQVMDGSQEEPRLAYSKEPLSENTLHSEFSDGENLLIMFEKEEYFTYDEYLQFLNPNEQQVLINGKNGISSSAEIKTGDGKAYVDSRVIVFLDDVQLRLESQMPEEQLLQIAESMIKEKSFQDTDSIPNEKIDDKKICGKGDKLVDGVCIVSNPKPVYGLDCEVLHIWNYAIDDCNFMMNSINFIFSLLLSVLVVIIISILIALKYKKRF